jgi:hypothetical protein
MIDRRQILLAAAAGAAMMTRIPNAQAATYDLLIKGGRVVDPSIGLDAVRDVAIAAGRTVSVEADIVADVFDTIDAPGEDSRTWADRHPHSRRARQGFAGATRRRDWPCRCRIGGTRQHRRDRGSATRRRKSAGLWSTSRRAPASPAAN